MSKFYIWRNLRNEATNSINFKLIFQENTAPIIPATLTILLIGYYLIILFICNLFGSAGLSRDSRHQP